MKNLEFSNTHLLETLQSLHTPSFEDHPYLWQFEGSQEGKHSSVILGLHGNEKLGPLVGLYIMPIVRDYIIAGLVNIMIGNPLAFMGNVRFLIKDANRLFGLGLEDILNKLPEKLWIEFLKPFLRDSALMIDVHSPINKPVSEGPNSSVPPLQWLMIPQIRHRLAHCIPHLGISTILTGPALWHPSGEAIESDQFVAKHGENGKGGLGITVEAWCETWEEVRDIGNGVISALVAIEILSEQALHDFRIRDPLDYLQHYKAYKQIFAGPKFSLPKHWKNFENIPAGTVIASKGDSEIITDQPSKSLFAKRPENVVMGNQALLLLEQEPRIFSRGNYNGQAMASLI